MQYILFPAGKRGVKDIGWLISNFALSFSDYHRPDRSAFGTLFAFNDDVVQAGKGFGTHPHVNMEIISVMLKGSMNHKDSMGYGNVVHEDGVQIMSAGSGLYHEEYNVGEGDVNFLQIWILPKQQNIRPRYQWRSFPKADRVNRLTTVVSPEEGLAHCWINQNAKVKMGFYDRDETLSYTPHPVNTCVFVFAIEGGLSVGGVELARRDAVGLWDAPSFDLRVQAGTQFALIETPVNQK